MSKNLELPYSLHKSTISYPTVIASCNGIICLDLNRHTHVSLWNPATREFRNLPQSPVRLPHRNLHASFSFGFGYDVRTNDYKVVRIIIENLWKLFTTKQGIKSRVELYKLSTNSWTTIDIVLPLHIIVSHPKAQLWNGIYCWLGRYHWVQNDKSDLHHHVILSFDFTKEMFGTIPLPEVYNTLNYSCSLMLALLRGNLACIDWNSEFTDWRNGHCQIWMLNDYNFKDSWTKLYTIVLDSRAYPKGILENDRIIWLKIGTSSQGKLCLYDPDTQESKTLFTEGTAFSKHNVIYKESLVLIKSPNAAANRVTCAVLPKIS